MQYLNRISSLSVHGKRWQTWTINGVIAFRTIFLEKHLPRTYSTSLKAPEINDTVPLYSGMIPRSTTLSQRELNREPPVGKMRHSHSENPPCSTRVPGDQSGGDAIDQGRTVPTGDSINQSSGIQRPSNATTRLTWDEHSELIISSIEECDFVALDVEYTGLHLKDDRYIGIDRCYEGHVLGAKQFTPCQIGLTTAKLMDNGIWRITPTSIYTKPPENTIFKVNTSTLSFLKDNGFDFNEWICNGVQYLRPEQEKERKGLILSQIEELNKLTTGPSSHGAPPPERLPNSNEVAEGGGQDNANRFDLSSIPDPNDRASAEEVISKIDAWIMSGDVYPLELPMESAFQRLLMHTIIGQQYPSVYSHSTRRGDLKLLCVYKSQSELYQQQKLALEQDLNSINKEVGIRLLLDVIINEKKILVGHNCFYDILHLYQTFYKELPNDVQEFKDEWIKMFPATFDTKFIAEAYNSNNSGTLKGLFDHLCHSETSRDKPTNFHIQTLPKTRWTLPINLAPLINNKETTNHEGYSSESCAHPAHSQYLSEVPDGHSKGGGVTEQDNDKGQLINDLDCEVSFIHDAGYDSFMTSIVFILQLSSVIRAKKRQARKDAKTKDEIMTLMSDVKNCIKLVKSQPNVVNLSGSNESDMARHFYMFGYPSAWKKYEIMKVWSPIWININQVDDTSCWISVKNDDDIRNINLIYRMMKNPQFTLYNYQQYKQKY